MKGHAVSVRAYGVTGVFRSESTLTRAAHIGAAGTMQGHHAGGHSTMKVCRFVLQTLFLLGLWLGLGLQAQAQTRTVHLYYTDPQGTVLAKTDAQGNIVAQYDYTPYGDVVTSLGSPPDGPGYTGHVNDPETGLVYMQARYYHPIGRFLSPDPIEPSAGNIFTFNRYAYVGNNPVVNIDPTGATCHQVGSGPSVTCQIDYVLGKGNELRVATPADHKRYAAFEKNLTNAVNKARTSGRRGEISFKSGGARYSFTISGTSVAKNLMYRSFIVDPQASGPGAMNSPDKHDTYVNGPGLNAKSSKYGDANRTTEMYIIHEGIHWSLEENEAMGSAQSTLGTDPKAHQQSYDDAANYILGH